MVWGCNAQAPEPPKFGVVDVGKVLSTAKASQKANAEVEALIRGKQAELNQKGEVLKNMEKSLKEPGSKVKPEDYSKAAGDYQKLAAAAEADVKKKATEIRKMALDQIKKIIENIGQEEKYEMIFVSDTVPYYQATTEVTEKVIKRYDEAGAVSAPTAPPATKAAPPATAPPITVEPVTPPPATKPAPPAKP